jgi:putative aldouronate transport system permease protein
VATQDAVASQLFHKPPTRLQRIARNKWLYIIMVPGILYFVIFRYLPMWGIVIAFQDYVPFLGVAGSEWVGFKHFREFFTNPDFLWLLRNTTVLALYNLFFFFPMPIILALLLNEIRSSTYKRVVQTAVYIPHFVSIVVVVSISYVFFTTEGGIINEWLNSVIGRKIGFLIEPSWFRPMVTAQVIWKETGWGTIIFLAALAGVDPNLYEAATVDGAGRWRQMWHITLPSVSSTIIILLILRLGRFLDSGFEHILLMVNSLNRDVGEVFDTFVYRVGLILGSFSYTTAVGLFKSIVGIGLVVLANRLAKRAGQASLY